MQDAVHRETGAGGEPDHPEARRIDSPFLRSLADQGVGGLGVLLLVGQIPGRSWLLSLRHPGGASEGPIHRVAEAVERMVDGVEPDKRFVYYLMGATGIVVVPLTGFQCRHHGFRGTLLEHDDAKRAWILQTLRSSIEQYVESGSYVAATARAG